MAGEADQDAGTLWRGRRGRRRGAAVCRAPRTNLRPAIRGRESHRRRRPDRRASAGALRPRRLHGRQRRHVGACAGGGAERQSRLRPGQGFQPHRVSRRRAKRHRRASFHRREIDAGHAGLCALAGEGDALCVVRHRHRRAYRVRIRGGEGEAQRRAHPVSRGQRGSDRSPGRPRDGRRAQLGDGAPAHPGGDADPARRIVRQAAAAIARPADAERAWLSRHRDHDLDHDQRAGRDAEDHRRSDQPRGSRHRREAGAEEALRGRR